MHLYHDGRLVADMYQLHQTLHKMTTVLQQYILTTQDHLMLLIPGQDFHTARPISTSWPCSVTNYEESKHSGAKIDIKSGT